MEDDSQKVELSGMLNDDNDREDLDIKRKTNSVLKKTTSNLSYEEADSALSDLNLEDEDNPRKREHLLIAKIQTLKEKLSKREKIINQMKEMMDNDDNVKKALLDKINELRLKIEKFKEDIQKNDDQGNEEDVFKLEEEGNQLDALLEKHTDQDKKKNDFFIVGNAQKSNKKINNFNMSNQLMGNYETRVYQIEVKLSNWEKFVNGLNFYLDYLMPLKGDITYIASHYDKNIEGFFEFLRFLFIFSIYIFLTYSFLIIKHAINFQEISKYGNLCLLYLPCFIFYSRFDVNEQVEMAYTFAFVCFVIFFGTIRNFLQFNKKGVIQKLYEGEESNYSKLFLNIWDWNVRDQITLEDYRYKIKNIITIGIKEEDIKETIKERTSEENYNLIFRRVFSITFSLIILLFSAFCIAGAYILRGYIAKLVLPSNSVSYYDLIPSLLIAVVNFIVPNILQCLVAYEKWDYNSTQVSQMMWRLYIARLFNIIVVYYLNLTLIVFGLTSAQISGLSSIDFGMSFTCPNKNSDYLTSLPENTATLGSNQYANCSEDMAVKNLFLNLIVDFISRKVIDIVSYLVAKYKRTEQMGQNYKPPYDVADTAPDSLIFIVQVYFLIPLFPYITILAPIFMFLDFKFEIFKINNLKSKAEKSSLKDETAFFIMNLFNSTMLIILVVFIFFFNFTIPHQNWIYCYSYTNNTGGAYFNTSTPNCGPFNSTVTLSTVMLKDLNSNIVFNFIYQIVSSPVFLLCALVIFIIFLFFSDESDSFINYLKQKDSENKNTVSGMNEQIQKLRNQVKMLRVNKLREE